MELLSEAEAVRRLGINRRTLQKYEALGFIKCVRVGRVKAYAANDVETFRQRCMFPSRPYRRLIPEN